MYRAQTASVMDMDSPQSSVTVNNISNLHLIVLLIKYTNDNNDDVLWAAHCDTLFYFLKVLFSTVTFLLSTLIVFFLFFFAVTYFNLT